MILLDTNVLSELMRPEPEPNVLHWMDGFDENDVWISAITVSEIRLGIAALPNGKRKTLLLDLTEEMIDQDFSRRCLPFDCDASGKYAAIVSKRKLSGHPITVEDAQIAAIALTAGLTLATRNTKDFVNIDGLEMINPWME